MLLSIALASMGFVQGASNTKILIDPTVSTGNPTETFWVDVDIEAVEDLYGWQVKIQYSPATRVIGAISVQQGTFLFGPDGTAMAYYVDGIRGVVHIGQTILGDWPGTTGSGQLCRVQFAVTEAGESDLILFETVLLDSNLDEVSHQTRDGSFDGVNTELVMIEIGARAKDVGQTAEFNAKVRNEDQHSAVLGAKARFDFTNTMTGRTTSLWSGQTYQYPPIREPIYLYVDGYTAERQQWTEVGASPFLDAPDDGNELIGTANAQQHRWFTFEDFVLGDAIIDYVDLEVYCEGPYDDHIDYDIYAPGFNWLGSWYGTGAGRIWQSEPRWVADPHASSNYPDLLTEAGINNMEALLYYYDPDGHTAGNDIIDCMRLHVVFKAGRAAEEPVVDGYTAERQQWTEVGASPFLDAPDDGNYIVGTANAQQHRWFTFEDIELGDSVVDEVRLWVYCEGPYDEHIDYDIYAPGFNWLGSYYGTGTGRVWQDQPRWVGPNDIASVMYPDLLTEEGINDFEALIYYYDPDGHTAGNDIIDAMYLEITFKVDRVALPLNEPVYDIQPGEVTWLEPLVWPLQPEDVGEYTCTVTCFYTYLGYRFNKDAKVITEHFRVDPAKK
jgi:hypothetical protein